MIRTIISSARCSQYVDTSGLDPLVQSGTMKCEAYARHPVIDKQINSGQNHWSDVEVLSLFCDGVQYTKRDSFFGLYIRNMRTNIEEMVFIIRTSHFILRGLILTSLRTNLWRVDHSDRWATTCAILSGGGEILRQR